MRNWIDDVTLTNRGLGKVVKTTSPGDFAVYQERASASVNFDFVWVETALGTATVLSVVCPCVAFGCLENMVRRTTCHRVNYTSLTVANVTVQQSASVVAGDFLPQSHTHPATTTTTTATTTTTTTVFTYINVEL